jgi:hypothetical protein
MVENTSSNRTESTLDPMLTTDRAQKFPSRHVKVRNRQIQRNCEQANQPLRPLIGTRSFTMPAITELDYIELVDFAGRQWHAGEKGIIDAREPRALTKLGLDKKH